MMKFKLLTLALCSLMAGNVFAVKGSCTYEIDFRAKGIQTTKLYNGKVVGSAYGNDSKTVVKNAAANQVKYCLKKALTSNKPSDCKDLKNGHKGTKARVTTYDIQGTLKQAVFNQICQIRKAQKGSNRVTEIIIGTSRKTSGCKGGFRIASKLSTTCKKNGDAKKTKQSYQNRTSDYYNKSASQLKAHIKKFCKKQYSMGGEPIIHKWLMNKKNGYLGAKYTCKN